MHHDGALPVCLRMHCTNLSGVLHMIYTDPSLGLRIQQQDHKHFSTVESLHETKHLRLTLTGSLLQSLGLISNYQKHWYSYTTTGRRICLLAREQRGNEKAHWNLWMPRADDKHEMKGKMLDSGAKVTHNYDLEMSEASREVILLGFADGSAIVDTPSADEFTQQLRRGTGKAKWIAQDKLEQIALDVREPSNTEVSINQSPWSVLMGFH